MSEVPATRETEISRLIDQFERAVDGDAWHGEPVMTLLERVPFEVADAKPAGGAHAIRAIVRHMAAWTSEVRRRMNGEAASTPPGGDWPRAKGRDAAAWRAEVESLMAAHQALLGDLRALPESALFEPINDPRYASGKGVTRYVLLHGLVQHHAYHAGQIALLSKR